MDTPNTVLPRFPVPFTGEPICFKDADKHKEYFVPPRHILHVKSHGGHTICVSFRDVNNKPVKYFCTMQMNDAEKFLTALGPFMRVHNQWIINLHELREHNTAEDELTMSDGTIVPISKKHIPELHAATNCFKAGPHTKKRIK
jgi:DNA-binding LytR/AlgR family response regulator